jgi:signal transduction histidine kinase
MVEALADLRRALERPLAPLPREIGTTLATELERLAGAPGPPVRVSWPPELVVPPDLEPLAQSVLAEAVRNAHKHSRPTCVGVRTELCDGTFVLEVSNDGVEGSKRRAGVGLRLAAMETLQAGGVLEFGQREHGSWRVRLVVPYEPERRR